MAAAHSPGRIVGIIGDPIAHSLSPRLHAAAFEACGLPWRYLAFRVRPAALADAVRGIRALGFAGANVTVPHKEAVLVLLDEVDAPARAIGAVNTLRADGERLVGFNTDAPGLLDALQRDGGIEVRDRRCLILGAGGAGRAAAFALAGAGAVSVLLLNRTPARAQEVAADLAEAVPRCRAGAGPLDAATAGRAAGEADVIIHATSGTMSVAMGGQGGRAAWLPAVREALRPGMTVLDMVYTPPWTELLAAARDAGATAVGGLSMLLYQGARSFELWTGVAAPVDAMRRAVESYGGTG